MPNLGHQLMNGRVTGSDTSESKLRLQPVFQVLWALPARLRIDKVRDSRHGPWLLNQCLSFREELLCQRGKRVAFHSICAQYPAQNVCLLNGDRNPLTIDRIQTANCVASGKQPTRKTVEPGEVSPFALRKAIADRKSVV